MSTESVLAAALALREFTLGQLGAYSGVDPDEVDQILQSVPGLVVAVAGGSERRVQDADALRNHLAARRGPEPAGRPGPRPADADPGPETRLERAEATLLECAEEESATARLAMAKTAMTYLRQYAATRLLDRPDWWTVDPGLIGVDDLVEVPAGARAGTPSRVRVDAALARLTASEATGRRVGWRLVRDAARDAAALPGSVNEPVLRPLLDRFLDLIPEAAPTVAGEARQARLLAAVALRRIRVEVDLDLGRASRQLVPVLHWMQELTEAPDHDGAQLYRVQDTLPGGGARLTVFGGLLGLVPEQYCWRREHEVVPGTLVEAVADPATVARLEYCAEELRRDLVRSPLGSDRALIGQAAHMLGELATSTAEPGDGVALRTQETRRELLTLVDAPVAPVADPPGEVGWP